MATAVGLAMKITADSTGLQKGVQKTVDTMDSLGGSTEKLDIIIALLAEAVELLAMQLDAMEKTSIRTSMALGDLAKATTSVATAYNALSQKNIALTAATAVGGTVFGTLGNTIFRSVAVRAVGMATGLGAAAGAIFGLAAATAAAGPGLKALEDFAERVGVEATKLGTSFAFVQTLEVAASRSGESIDSLRVAFTALLRNIEAARGGSNSAIEAFEKLGISAADLESKSPEEIFKAIAVGLQGISDPATRSAAALVVLGENGARLQPALRSVANAEADLARFSATLDGLDIARLEDMGYGFDQLQTATGGLGRQLILPFAGLTEGISKALADIIGGTSSIVAALGGAVSPLLDAFGAVIQTVGSVIGVILKLIAAVLRPLAYMFELIGGLVEFFSDGLDNLTSRVNAGIDGWLQYFNMPESWFTDAASGAEETAAALDDATTASQKFYEEITKAVDTAAEFGQAGFDAALEYQEALEEINLLRQEGEYTEEQANEAAKRANETFEERIGLLKEAADEQARAAQEARRAAEADRKRIDQFARSGMSEQERAQADAQETVLAIQREQARVEQEIAAARNAGNQAALDAATARLAQLDQEEARAADIASGDAARREAAQQEREEYQSKLDDLQAEFARKEIERSQSIADKRAEYNERLAEIEEDRLDKLSAVNQKALEASDIRSGGIGQVIALATGREDPAVAAARQQAKSLENIEREIKKLGGTVEIVGAA
jgi:hypothetical protein